MGTALAISTGSGIVAIEGGGSSSLENQSTQIWSEWLTGTAHCHLRGAVTHPHSKGKTQASHLAFPSTGGSYGGIKWPWGHQPQAGLTRSFLALRPRLEGHPEAQSLKQPPGTVGLYIASPALTIPCLWL